MGRPPCCEQVSVKKGPWTPEEDLILVSYIQEHGPGNWKAVPTKTGLSRCSKSCRLRWTNYLRPGIKRGSFTEQEEKLIVHLQALVGNRWAAIASYLPNRTDNDIKNYWNTHLKKKLSKLQNCEGSRNSALEASSYQHSSSSPGAARQENPSQHPPAAYASSAENIARLLRGWSKDISPRKRSSDAVANSEATRSCSMFKGGVGTPPSASTGGSSICLSSVLKFVHSASEISDANLFQGESAMGLQETPEQLTMLEDWLLEDSIRQGGGGAQCGMPLDDSSDMFQ